VATDLADRQAEKGQDIPLLTFGSDRPLRRRFFVPEAFLHPAKLHLGLLSFLVDRYTHPGDILCDPMAGSGSILLAALSGRDVIARDVEPHWVALMRRNAERIAEQAGLFAGQIVIEQANAMQPWGLTRAVDAVICSPPYGCEMSASPHAQKTLPYRLWRLPQHDDRWDRYLSAPNGATAAMLTFHYGTSAGQVGGFRGRRYWQAMHAVYEQAYDAIRPGGKLLLILKDHIKDGQRVPTADMTAVLCQNIGFQLIERFQRLVYPLSLWQRRRKEQGLPVVEEEDVLIFNKEFESYDHQ
jgi:DNA modification methylase